MGFNIAGAVIDRCYFGNIEELEKEWNSQLKFIGEISFEEAVENWKEDFDQQVNLVSRKSDFFGSGSEDSEDLGIRSVLWHGYFSSLKAAPVVLQSNYPQRSFGATLYPITNLQIAKDQRLRTKDLPIPQSRRVGSQYANTLLQPSKSEIIHKGQNP